MVAQPSVIIGIVLKIILLSKMFIFGRITGLCKLFMSSFERGR